MKPLFANYGVGTGLRIKHFPVFLNPETRPRNVDWVEVISENMMPAPQIQSTRNRHTLEKVREHYPVALHGISMSLGSASGLDPVHLRNLKILVDEVEPIVVSEHLCWTRVDRRQTHDLNPLPYTEAMASFVSEQILRVQDALKRRILIENVSSYVTFKSSMMEECEFLSEIAKRADCGLLLDINNVYVSATNHGFDARRFLSALPHDRVGQVHLAGHTNEDGFLIDTHDEPICEPVWDLYRWYGKQYGHPSAMIERDANIPDWQELSRELDVMRTGFVPNVEVTRARSDASMPQKAFSGPSDESSKLAFVEDYKRQQHVWVDALVKGGVAEDILSDVKKSAEERFKIYEEGFWVRLKNLLEFDFREFKKELNEREGDDGFKTLVKEVLTDYPPESYTVYELALQWMKGLRARRHPLLPLAEREWARELAFLAQAKPLPPGVESRLELLGQENPEDFDRICLVLHPSLQVLSDVRTLYWFDRKAREKAFSPNDWPAIVALTSKVPLSQWEGVSGLTPENIQIWTQEGLICGYQKI